MPATVNSRSVGASPQAGTVVPRSARPAATAAGRVWVAGLGFGVAGLVLCGFVVARLFSAWRVSAHAASHHVSLLGRGIGYPVANLDAWLVLALAVAGLAVGARVASGAIHEVLGARAFARWLSTQSPWPLRDAWVIPDERPHAFCAGLISPRVYVSSGALALLDEPALTAVLAHERHHARCRDPLRLAVGRVLARALFFVPGLGELVRRQQDLAEFGADETAMNASPDGRSGLASAMLALSEPSPPLNSAGIDPRRVDHLLGAAPAWRFPTLLCLAAGGVIGLAAAIAVLVGQVAAGSATLAPPFLSHQPCVVALALIPGAVGLGCAGVARALTRRPSGGSRNRSARR
jgi:hypothetical protein